MFGRQLSLNGHFSGFSSQTDQHLASANELSALNGGKPHDTLPKAGKKLPTLLAARKWVRVNKQGEANVAQADKHLRHHLQQALGVQLRDLRILDPALAASYPSAILVREKALVVNLEHIKCVISTSCVYVLNADDETVIAFIEELQRRLVLVATHTHALDGPTSPPGQPDLQKPDVHPHDEMPFELRVLEVALDVVCSQMERQTGDLEAAAHPALDGLTQRVTTQNLERVRRIKNRMVRLTTKVETVREVLEKFLDDDSDMKDMNLTAREEEAAERASSLSLQRHSQGLDLPSFRRKSAGHDHDHEGSELPPDSDSSDSDSEVDEVEMVLEAYFMQLDNTYNKLQTLCEYIDDTEDYINIELDSQRNQLIRIDLLLTAATFCASIISVVTGIFGMNLNNTHEDSYPAFIMTSAISSGGAVIIFVLIVLYCRHKKLLSFV